jgi:hypothetical protein
LWLLVVVVGHTVLAVVVDIERAQDFLLLLAILIR